jgi:hypothetical protein
MYARAVLSRFRACRFTRVAAKKFKAPVVALFSGGYSLMPQPHHVKAAELSQRERRDPGQRCLA